MRSTPSRPVPAKSVDDNVVPSPTSAPQPPKAASKSITGRFMTAPSTEAVHSQSLRDLADTYGAPDDSFSRRQRYVIGPNLAFAPPGVEDDGGTTRHGGRTNSPPSDGTSVLDVNANIDGRHDKLRSASLPAAATDIVPDPLLFSPGPGKSNKPTQLDKKLFKISCFNH